MGLYLFDLHVCQTNDEGQYSTIVLMICICKLYRIQTHVCIYDIDGPYLLNSVHLLSFEPLNE